MRKLTIPLICCFFPVYASATTLGIHDGEPDHHIVVKGDTLWAISAKAYHDPLKWPYLWALNRGLIKAPHWIYPRQNLLLYPSFPRLKMEQRLESPRGAIQLAPVRPAQPQTTFVPEISTHILSIFGGVSQKGQQTMVIIDKGQNDGVRDGLVLELHRDKYPSKDPGEKLPMSGENYGSLQVFHTRDKVSYAVVTRADMPVMLMDVASSKPAVLSAPPVQVAPVPVAETGSAMPLVQAAAIETPVSTAPSNIRKGQDARECLKMGSDREIAACAERFR